VLSQASSTAWLGRIKRATADHETLRRAAGYSVMGCPALPIADITERACLAGVDAKTKVPLGGQEQIHTPLAIGAEMPEAPLPGAFDASISAVGSCG